MAKKLFGNIKAVLIGGISGVSTILAPHTAVALRSDLIQDDSGPVAPAPTSIRATATPRYLVTPRITPVAVASPVASPTAQSVPTIADTPMPQPTRQCSSNTPMPQPTRKCSGNKM